MPNAILFKSDNRFESFKEKLKIYDVHCTVLDFADQEWIHYDYSNIDFIIYFATFKYSSNHPHALLEVHDNLTYIHSQYPEIKIFPDPNGFRFYNDKYRQFLFLSGHDYPIPKTIPLLSDRSIDFADETLGYPMVIKNRYGAGGGSVYRVYNKKELIKYYNLSKMNFWNPESALFFLNKLKQREFLYYLVKEKKAEYPLFSPPVLAQKFITIDKDLKTVVGNFKVVEGHWRFQANEDMWKVNIDDGGIGVWTHIPDEAIDLSVKLAKDLNMRWLNIDMMVSDGKFLITEFSPVWHHYRYKEKDSFEYRDDYNIDLPLEVSLDLERIIIESFLE